VIGTLVVDGWAGTARRGLGGLEPRPVSPHYTKCNSPPINGQCTNFILFDAPLDSKGLSDHLIKQTIMMMPMLVSVKSTVDCVL